VLEPVTRGETVETATPTWASRGIALVWAINLAVAAYASWDFRDRWWMAARATACTLGVAALARKIQTASRPDGRGGGDGAL